jgi:hypothetical protein
MLALALTWMVMLGAPAAEGTTLEPTALAGTETPSWTTVAKKSAAKKSTRPSSSKSSMAVLTGQWGWLVAAALGAVVPLVFFVIPLVLVHGGWLGPSWFLPWAFYVGWAGVWLLFAATWGALMTGAGSILTWGIMTLFSDTQSGFVVPVLVGSAWGGSVTLAAGLVAGTIMLGGALLNAFFFQPRAWSGPNYFIWGSVSGPFTWVAAVMAFAVWSTGVAVAGLGATFWAGYMYKKLGRPRVGDETTVMPVTP